MTDKTTRLSLNSVDHRIYFIRNQRVILDRDLASLYQVSTSRLNEQVRRNLRRFPPDFMFRLTSKEAVALRSQNAILEKTGKGRYSKYLAYAFTEQGVAMLSGILHSDRAIDVNVAIMRAFVRMRQVLSENRELAEKLSELENKLVAHDYQIADIVEAIRDLMQPSEKEVPKIGYRPLRSMTRAHRATLQ